MMQSVHLWALKGKRQEKNYYFWPSPRTAKSVFCKLFFFFFFLNSFSICQSIDSKWSKTYDWEKKCKINWNPSKYIFLCFRTLCIFLSYLFLSADMSATNRFFLYLLLLFSLVLKTHLTAMYDGFREKPKNICNYDRWPTIFYSSL